MHALEDLYELRFSALSDLHHDHEGDHVVEERRQEPILVVLQQPLLVLRQRLVPVQQVLDVAVHADQLPLAGHDIWRRKCKLYLRRIVFLFFALH